MIGAMDLVGNPSSAHGGGRAARRVLEDARDGIEARLGGTVVFTSGGTEANAAAIHALRPGRRMIVGATEHDAVRRAASGAETLPVDSRGIARLEALAAMLAAGEPTLVCLMLANNETGT